MVHCNTLNTNISPSASLSFTRVYFFCSYCLHLSFYHHNSPSMLVQIMSVPFCPHIYFSAPLFYASVYSLLVILYTCIIIALCLHLHTLQSHLSVYILFLSIALIFACLSPYAALLYTCAMHWLSSIHTLVFFYY